MSSGKRTRRPGGHPAKVAQRRARERDRAPADPLRRAARAACRDAASIETALEAELMASSLLGSWWPSPLALGAGEPDHEIGVPLVAEIERCGGPGALAALIAIGEVSDSELGLDARERAGRLRAAGVRAPGWADTIKACEVRHTAVLRDEIFDDGITIFIECAHAGGEPHAVGVYIDHNLGVMAKDILLADSIDEVAEIMRSNPEAGAGGALVIEPIDPAEACGRLNAALDLTDMTLMAPVGEDYASLRSLARLRADELPGGAVDIEPPQVTPEERKRLLTEFLASPDGAGFEPGGDEAFAVSLAIDFCADYVDGRPLRWSPVTVERFMADWLPRKVVAERSQFEAVPAALASWVRFAGRRRGIPEWAIAETIDAIVRWTEEMLERASDPEAGGPGIEFLLAAKSAGVELADEQALASFIAAWNARNEAGESPAPRRARR